MGGVNSGRHRKFQSCEWCGVYTGGALLCANCESLEIWNCQGVRGDNESQATDSTATTVARRGVLRAHSDAPRIPIKPAASVVGGAVANRGDVGGVRAVWKEFSFVPRSAMTWPEVTA